ncbi:hypothetical protein OHA70_09235 [Kribbella sp. NBC_00382]|uniref:hypothetical protein n=1 Tax=Kribbella sp. NBC_00382 TaxID=2975967 RepID=UPI002E1A293E
MSFETELRDRLHAGVDDTPADLDLLLTGGVAHGNKLVRRRRLTRIFAGAATVAVLGGAFTYAGTLGGPNSITPAGQSGKPAVVQGKQGALTPQAALGILLELLPDAELATNQRGGFDGMGTVRGVYATSDYDTTSLRIEVLKNKIDVPLQCFATDTYCKVSKLPDGSRLRLLDVGYPGPAGKDEYQQLQANLTRPDGLNLNLIAVNTDPAHPVLTLAQLKAIATDARWQLKVDQAFINRSAKLFTPRLVTQPSVPQPIGTPPTSPGASK